MLLICLKAGALHGFRHSCPGALSVSLQISDYPEPRCIWAACVLSELLAHQSGIAACGVLTGFALTTLAAVSIKAMSLAQMHSHREHYTRPASHWRCGQTPHPVTHPSAPAQANGTYPNATYTTRPLTGKMCRGPAGVHQAQRRRPGQRGGLPEDPRRRGHVCSGLGAASADHSRPSL